MNSRYKEYVGTMPNRSIIMSDVLIYIRGYITHWQARMEISKLFHLTGCSIKGMYL